MVDTRANIEMTWIPDLRQAAGPLARALPHPVSQPLPVVPSSLRHDDGDVATIREALREGGLRTVVVTPRSPAALLTARRGSTWQEATIDGTRWRIDSRLAAPWVAITTIDAENRTGPFALDLPARFLHPADRIRLATRPDRLRLLADIAANALPAACLLLTPADAGWLVAATREPIAAELWALGLAERFHPADVEMQGPWEESTVQRATELGFGIRIPDDMRISVNVPVNAPVARDLLFTTAARLGLSLNANQATG